MQAFKQDFTPRQYMITPDFEYFHYLDESDMEIEYHNHDFYEIYFFVSGKVVYVIEGKSYKLRPGDILLVHSEELHKPIIESGNAYQRIVLWVNPEFLKKQSTESSSLSMCFENTSPKRHNLLRPSSEILSSIKGILSKFERACNSSGFGNGILRNTYLIELLVYLNRAFMENYDEEMDTDIEFNEKIDSIIRFINENLNMELPLNLFSSKFFISKYHLIREFKKYTGYTIHRFIREKRLILAKALLREGLQVSEACMKCGFGDYSNFIRSFKNSFGVPPKKYLKTIQNL